MSKYAPDGDDYHVLSVTDPNGYHWVQVPERGHYYGKAEAEADAEVLRQQQGCTVTVVEFYTPEEG